MTDAITVPTSFDEIRSLALPRADGEAAKTARTRQAHLTKPGGSLGRLEDIAAWAAAWQGRSLPVSDPVQVLVFAGNHGVADLGVSAFPSAVTAQMVANFRNGGAAINQISKAVGAELSVIPLDLDRPTGDFTRAPALSEADCIDHIVAGMTAVAEDTALVCIGEMGIANTTVAAALCCALYGGPAADWVGRGTGIDNDGLARKTEAVAAAMSFHGDALSDPLEALRRVGGRELAAMFGAILGARLKRVPVMLDGFVCGAAAAVLARLQPGGLDHCLASHRSAEAGHRRLLDELSLVPLLDLNMRLGEASGAGVAAGLFKTAIAIHSGMATFGEAGVSDTDAPGTD